MIYVLFNVAVLATLGLCIVGFSAWAQKRVIRRAVTKLTGDHAALSLA